MQFFAPSNGYFELDQSFFTVERKGDAGEAFFLNERGYAKDFLFVCKKLSFSSFFMIVNIAKAIGTDGAAYEPQLVFRYIYERLLKRGSSLFERFDLGSLQSDTHFECLYNFILKCCFSIGEKFFV